MAVYNVYGKVVGTKYLGEYEADSEDEAIEKALQEHVGSISLCHQCSSECEDAELDDATAELIPGRKRAKKARGA